MLNTETSGLPYKLKILNDGQALLSGGNSCCFIYTFPAVYNCSVWEEEVGLIPACMIKASDNDTGKFGTVAYHLLSQNTVCLNIFVCIMVLNEGYTSTCSNFFKIKLIWNMKYCSDWKHTKYKQALS